MRPVFVITVDTEGDNLWARPRTITTKNAQFLPRFQRLCESHGFKPTYLVNYEMAIDKEFQAFGHAVLQTNFGEIGTHLHASNSPPLAERKEWREGYVYVTDLPDVLIHEKMSFLTKLLTDIFETKPVSHRGGRWALDGRVVRELIELGYLVDCTVTPGVTWRRNDWTPQGCEPSYVGFGIHPYFSDPDDIRRPGISPLLEVPMTIRPNYRPLFQRIYDSIAKKSELTSRAISKLTGEPYMWFRMNYGHRAGHSLEDLKDLVDWALTENLPVVQFMIHSSELMPGGSPYFVDGREVEKLYSDLDNLFQHIASKGIMGSTLAEFRHEIA